MSHNKLQGIITRWVDGDTVEINGWTETAKTDTATQWVEAFGSVITTTTKTTTVTHVAKPEIYRLTIVDTPERGDPGYYEAKAYVNYVLQPGAVVQFTTHGVDDGGFGRTLADILVPGEGGTTISSLLLERGHAVPWKKAGSK